LLKVTDAVTAVLLAETQKKSKAVDISALNEQLLLDM
jgi:hypothetical protein